MSDESKEIRLFDDSVIKLTIKQGLESERFPVTEIKNGGIFVYNGDNLTITDYTNINSVSGALTTGELGWTRDTNRLFVGNISEDLAGSQQQTLGGVLTGNKYLGYIDSRNGNAISKNVEENATPLALSDLLSEGSEYRSYNFTTSNNVIWNTEDKKWPKLPHYNETYDAYDGDYMYDIYRNALILFDHNIRPLNNKTAEPNGTTVTVGGKRKTPLIPRFEEEAEKTVAQKAVYNFTKDMYGDGYVLFYNVIPDGETLTFESKGFKPNKEYYNSAEDAINYSYNVIKINKVPAETFMSSLDPDYFSIAGEGQSQLITLSAFNKPVTWKEKPAETSSDFLLINDASDIKPSSIKISAIETLISDNKNFNNKVLAILNGTDGSGGVYATTAYVDSKISSLSTGGPAVDINMPSLSSGIMDWASAVSFSYATAKDNGAIYNATTGELKITPTVNKDKEQIPNSDYYVLVKVKSGNLTVSVTSGKFENDTWVEEKYTDEQGVTHTIEQTLTIASPGESYLSLSFGQADKVTLSGSGLNGYIIPLK